MWNKARDTANTLINNLGNVDPNGDLPSYREKTQTDNVVNFKRYEQMEKDVADYDREVDRLVKKHHDAQMDHAKNMARIEEDLKEAQWRLNTAEDSLKERVKQSLKNRYDVEITRKPPPSPDDVSFETPLTMPEGEQ